MKTTNRQFETFKAVCLDYGEQWFLKDWEIYFLHEDLDASVMAEADPDLASRSVTIRFAKNWPESIPINEDEIRKVAKHEMLHILLAPVEQRIGIDRHISNDEQDEAGHEVIHRLMLLLND